MTQTLRSPLAPFARQDCAIPTYLFHLITSLFYQRGLNTVALTLDAGIKEEELTQEGTLISFDQSMVIIDNALTLSGDSALGLAIGRQESLSDLGMLGYAIASCKNGWDALRIAESYFQTTTNLTHVQMNFGENECRRYSRPTHQVSEHLFRFLVDEDLSGHVKLTRDFLDESYAPLAVHFAYPEPDNLSLYQDFFRCPLVFDAPVSQVLIQQTDLERTNQSYNPVTESLAIKLCDEMLLQQDSNRSLVGKVHLALLRTPEKYPSIQEVAEQLAMSERSLRRRLTELNTSYKEIFNTVRQELALRYLQDSNLAMEDIAQLVGFSDSTSFYRSFKKWTGKAPSSYRSNAIYSSSNSELN